MHPAAPLFIHSLFRSGSTYFLSKFSSLEGVTCVNEAIHEQLLGVREDPGQLLRSQESDKREFLRHPADSTYFSTLSDSWSAWKDSFSDETIYKGFFLSSPPNDSSTKLASGVPLYNAIIHQSSQQCIFGETRSAGRLAAIKEHCGGRHFYLYRNPWDQWWSMRTSSYFDECMQMILQANPRPLEIDLLKQQLELPELKESSFEEQWAFLQDQPLSAAASYQSFYLIWMLCQQRGVEHADHLISIDLLSTDPTYRQAIERLLSAEGFPDVAFADAAIPKSIYGAKDNAFFSALEDNVHQRLKDANWTDEDIRSITAMGHTATLSHDNHRDRIREALLTSMDKSAATVMAWKREVGRLKKHIDWQSTDNATLLTNNQTLSEQQAIHQHELALLQQNLVIFSQEGRLLTERVLELRRELEQAHQKAVTADLLADQLQASYEEINRLYASHSWQITRPLRGIRRKATHYISVAKQIDPRHWPTKLLNHSLRVLNHYPRLVTLLRNVLQRVFPRVYQRLTAVAGLNHSVVWAPVANPSQPVKPGIWEDRVISQINALEEPNEAIVAAITADLQSQCRSPQAQQRVT